MAKKKSKKRNTDASQEDASAVGPDTLIGHIVFYAGERYLKELETAPRKRGFGAGTVVFLVVAVALAVVGIVSLGEASTAILGLALVSVAMVLLGGALASMRPRPAVPDEGVEELKALDARIKATCKELGIRCYGCDAAASETIRQGASVHGFDADAVVAAFRKLKLDMSIYEKPAGEQKHEQ